MLISSQLASLPMVLTKLNNLIRSFSVHFLRFVVCIYTTFSLRFLMMFSMVSIMSKNMCSYCPLSSKTYSLYFSWLLMLKPLKIILRADRSGQAFVDYHRYYLNFSFMCCLYFSKYPYPHTLKDSVVNGTFLGSI